jgi:hypothetical protein
VSELFLALEYPVRNSKAVEKASMVIKMEFWAYRWVS